MSPEELESKVPAGICSSKAEPAAHSKEEHPWTCGLSSARPSISPWLLECSSKLLGFTSTENLPECADVVIVGSGITGAFAAHFLKEEWAKDLSVVMLEAREACWGASGQSTGAVEALLFENAWDVSAFKLEGIQFLREFVKDNEIPCEWQDCLGVHVSSHPLLEFSSASVTDIKNAMPDSMGQMIDTALWDSPPSSSSSPHVRDKRDATTTGDGWDVDKIRATLAGLGMHDADGVVLQANAATIHPYRLVAWILERLLERHEAESFALHTNTPVTRLSQRAAATADRPGTGNWTLTTPRGDISAGRVLLATNGYTSALLPELEELIVPVRCQAAAAAPASGSLKKKPVDLESRLYTFVCKDGKRDERWLQRGGAGGQLIVAGGRHVAVDFGVGHWRDDVTEPRVERHLEGLLEGLLSGGERNGRDCRAEMPEIRHWAGIEGYPRDYKPWVGAVPELLGGGPGLFLCAGYALGGLAMAPLCAKRVVQEMAMTKATTASETQGKMRFPPRLLSEPERVDIAMEEWPDVLTMEEEGLGTYIKIGVGQILKGRNEVPCDSSFPAGLRRFWGKGAMGRKW